ncbi:MAG: hypothetical protein JXR96_25480 [Deltaproteobacteria bacterium]|nr:hypothetical protein [Deltaproteobacteria bacterium]
MQRRARAVPVWLVCCLVAWPQIGSAFDFTFPWLDEPASFSISATSVFDYHDRNFDGSTDNDEYYDLRNRLNLELAVMRFALAVRLDSATFFSEPSPEQGNAPYLDRYAPEKVHGSWSDRHWKVDLGDYYASLGRGLALRIRKTDQLGEDTTLLGARLGFRCGPWEAQVLTGLSNPSNTDLYEKTLADPYDLVSAVRLAWRPFERAAISVHGSLFYFDPLDRNDQAYLLDEHISIAGAAFELPGDALGLYAEVDWLGRRRQAFVGQTQGDFDQGWAAYASADLTLADWTLTAEIKSSRDFYAATFTSSDDGQHSVQRIDYVRPPTLELESMEVKNNHSVHGARLQADWRPGAAGTLLFASGAGFLAEDQAGHSWISNLSLGVEQRFLSTGRARLALGWREESPDYDGTSTRLYYTEAELKLPLAARHSLDLHGTSWVVRERMPDSDFLKGEWTLGYAYSPYLAASLIFGFDTSPSGCTELSPFYTEVQPPRRQLFLAGSVSVNLFSKYLLRVLAGQVRGGLTCVDGVCKNLPAFAGVRTELTLRF